MSTIFGALKLADTDRVFRATTGQRVIYDAARQYVEGQNAALNAVLANFVEQTTEDHTLRYKLPGGGMLQRRGGQAQSGAVKATGSWDVAFPLEEYGDQIAGDDVAMAYMTAAELDRHIQTVVIRNINTVRFEMLKALFNNAARTFVDPLWGNLTVQPLANGDSVVYPPVVGSASEAADTHYLASGYANSAVSDANDPIADIAIPELEEHFGQATGGSPIVVFLNAAEVPYLTALTGVVSTIDRYIAPGANTDVPSVPAGLPGRFIGRHVQGAFLQQWDWIPSGYLFALHLDAPKPLFKRRDPADTGLPDGLAMVAEDKEYPFEQMHWRHRFGFGVANRLNGVLIQLTASSFSVPTAYA